MHNTPFSAFKGQTDYTWPSRFNRHFKFMAFWHPALSPERQSGTNVRNLKCRLNLNGTEHF